MTEDQDILTMISSFGVHTKETSPVGMTDTIWSPDHASRSEAILGRGSSHTARWKIRSRRSSWCLKNQAWQWTLLTNQNKIMPTFHSQIFIRSAHRLFDYHIWQHSVYCNLIMLVKYILGYNHFCLSLFRMQEVWKINRYRWSRSIFSSLIFLLYFHMQQFFHL